ncbi:hypothetical protein ACH4OY_13720 [Micromonospora rubida]|uniref:Uncharacterized protein n=1 Tax=Micromonospora rubida TaxID=2697657 RepID=A0ABW7SJ59_9ACTN
MDDLTIEIESLVLDPTTAQDHERIAAAIAGVSGAALDGATSEAVGRAVAANLRGRTSDGRRGSPAR